MLIALVLLASCKGDRTMPIANTGGAAISVVPTGWVALEPDDERLRCANYASDEWQVAIDGTTVKLTVSKDHEADTGVPTASTSAAPRTRWGSC